MVNEKRMLGTFYDLVRIYAPSGGEREVCEYLKKKAPRTGSIPDRRGSCRREDRKCLRKFDCIF